MRAGQSALCWREGGPHKRHSVNHGRETPLMVLIVIIGGLTAEVLEILRNPTTNPPDRVKSYSFKGSSGSFAKIFDGTEGAVSWDNILWINRTELRP